MFTLRVARRASRGSGVGSYAHTLPKSAAAWRWAIAALAGTCTGLAGTPMLAAVVAVGSAGAAAHAQCGTASITQSTSPDVIQAARAAWCGTLAFNDLTQIGRGFVAPYDLTVGCVRFGVTSNTGADWPCIVRIRLGTLADPYDSHAVLGERSVTIPAGTTSAFFTADFGTVYLPAGTAFVVELETPSRNPDEGGDGALLSLGFNALGQSGPTMLRSEPCGVPQFTDLASIGFPNSHAAISIGVSEGRDLPVFGFPITPMRQSAVGTHDGFTSAYLDASESDVGLSVHLGETTMGASVTIRAIATGDEPDPTVQISFRSISGRDSIVFRNYEGDTERATIDLDFDTPHFDRFDFEVYLEGELVGVLEDQESGSVVLTDPGDGLIEWIKKLFGGIKGKAGCEIRKEYYPESEGGGLKSEYMFYGIEVGRVAASNPGLPPLIGDSFAIVPRVPVLPDSPPVAIDVLVGGIAGVGMDVAKSPPSILIGVDDTKPQDVGKDKPKKTTKGTGVVWRPSTGEWWRQTSPTQLSGDDVDGDGIPDLVVRPGSPVPGEPDASVRLDFGGVFSASVGLEVVSPEPFAACMTVCAFEVGRPPIPSGKTQFDPWPGVPDFIAIVPDFTGVGSGLYTIEVYDQAGTLVYAESGQSGLAGGTSQWARDIGKIGGRTPCYRIKFPRDTVFRTTDGRHFDADEIRLLAEGAADAGPIDSLIIDVMGMERLHLLGPTTELTDPAERCYGDFDSDGALTIFDFLAYQNAFGLGRASADCDGDGALTFFDFLCFQNAFARGCP